MRLLCACVFRSQTHSLGVVPGLERFAAVWEEGRATGGQVAAFILMSVAKT